MAADSDFAGSHDIRGYELLKVHSQLARLGAQVMIISDSCHSGSVYRSLDRQRTLPAARAVTRAGWVHKMICFRSFQRNNRHPDENHRQMPPGRCPGLFFIRHAETGNAHMRPRTIMDDRADGYRSSCAICWPIWEQKTTYQELAGKVAAQFAARWPGDVAAVAGVSRGDRKVKTSDFFAAGSRLPMPTSGSQKPQSDGMVKLTMGNLLGVLGGIPVHVLQKPGRPERSPQSNRDRRSHRRRSDDVRGAAGKRA